MEMQAISVIIGNIFSLCAMISDSISGTRKKHSEIMAVQIVSQVFYGASSAVLKGYSSNGKEDAGISLCAITSALAL